MRAKHVGLPAMDVRRRIVPTIQCEAITWVVNCRRMALYWHPSSVRSGAIAAVVFFERDCPGGGRMGALWHMLQYVSTMVERLMDTLASTCSLVLDVAAADREGGLGTGVRHDEHARFTNGMSWSRSVNDVNK